MNPDTQEKAGAVAGMDSVDIEQDPNYRDFIEKQPKPNMAELRAKLETIWDDKNV